MIFIFRNIDKLILAFILLIFFILNTNLLLVEPSVWPDEAYIADTARNIFQEKRSGTDLWGDTIIGIRKSLYWYPPIYVNTLALWFKFFGLAIFNQRILSLILGMLFLVVVYFLSQNILSETSFKKKKVIGLSLIILLIFDNSFLKASKIGRPEMMVVVLGFLALYVYRLTRKLHHQKTLYILIGFILGLTGLTHLIGALFLLIVLSSMLFYKKDRMFNFLIIGFIPPMLIWLISILPNYDICLKQLSLQQSFRTLVHSYIESVFRLSSFELKTTYILYLLLSGICFLFLYKKRPLKHLFLYVGLFISWLICIGGKLEWYSIYIVSFLYILVFVLINSATKILAIIASVLLVSLFLINLKIYFNSYTFYQGKGNLYFIYGQKIKEKIPVGKTIYLSATPDPYFVLVGRNPLYEFPGVNPIEKEYLNLLNDSDYMVINFHLEHLFIGNLLDKYIELNSSKEYQISDGILYSTQIIELVPKNMRKLPK